MPAIGVIFFYALFVLLISRIVRKKEIPLTITQIALAFGCKVLLGCLYGYIFLHYYHGDDTWAFHKDSWGEYEKLIHDPVQFFRDFGPASAFGATDDRQQAFRYYMNDLEYWSMIKMLGVFNIFSRGDYYINTVFFNFVVFWGQYILFAQLVRLFSDKKKALLITIFFIPPFLFWLSGIRSDGLLLLFLAIVIRHFYRWLYERKTLSLLWCVAGMLGLFIFRSLWLVVLLPALASWLLVVRLKREPLVAFVSVYGLLITLCFASTLLSPDRNVLTLVVKRQQEFFSLRGNTVFPLRKLEPNFTSFITVLPQAIEHTFLRPYLWEAKGPLQVLSAIETVLFLALVIVAIWKRDSRWRTWLTHPLLLLFLCYAVSLNILIGYMVPFPGAIERYRVIPLLLLCIIGAVTIKWPKRINVINF